jgi:hypothetical protein
MVRNTRRVWIWSLLVALSVGSGALSQDNIELAFRAAPEVPAWDANLNCIEDDGPRWPAEADAFIARGPGAGVKGADYCALDQLRVGMSPRVGTSALRPKVATRSLPISRSRRPISSRVTLRPATSGAA